MTNINTARLRSDLIRFEGVRGTAYRDSLGYWTIGVGRLIDERKGGGLDELEIEYLLNNDIQRTLKAVEAAIPFFGKLAPRQQEGLIVMAFQLGVNGLMQFKRLLAALQAGDFNKIRVECRDSLWGRQTPERANAVAAMLCDTMTGSD